MRAPLLLLLSLTVGATALSQRVAVVTGASRGIGKAIAVALGEQGFAVYALARSSRTGGRAESPDARALPEGVELSVEATAEAITAAGGRGIALRCDIGDDADLERALRQVADEEKRLDVLVCSAYSTPPGKLRGPFWEQGMPMWDAVNGVGLRSVFAACTAAVPLMIETRKAQPSAGRAVSAATARPLSAGVSPPLRSSPPLASSHVPRRTISWLASVWTSPG